MQQGARGVGARRMSNVKLKTDMSAVGNWNTRNLDGVLFGVNCFMHMINTQTYTYSY